MKKLLLVFVPFLLIGCAKEPTSNPSQVPPTSYSVTLNPTTSTLTSDDSSETFTVTLKANEDQSVTYQVEIGAPCYIKQVQGTSYHEIIMKNGGYFKSISTYKVNKVSCDIFEGKGVNYEVFSNTDASGDPLEKYASDMTPTYAEDQGAVYDYNINANQWLIRNNSAYKPAFYAVTIFFEV